jgi:hypothetical protein
MSIAVSLLGIHTQSDALSEICHYYHDKNNLVVVSWNVPTFLCPANIYIYSLLNVSTLQ